MNAVIEIGDDMSSRDWRRLAWIRAGVVLGLLFLIGPLADLGDASLSTARTAAILTAFAAFVVVYMLLVPPARFIVGGGLRAIHGGLALLALLAATPLALGAPHSFAALFVYVVAAAGLLLPARVAVPLFIVAAAALGVGFVAAGADSSSVAAYTLNVLAVGAVTVAVGSLVRANRELREAREELARSAVYEERLRIARDLHDLLGHTLSLIALKTELATKLVERDSGRALDELREIQSVTRQALTEVRDAVQGYRRRSLADALRGAEAAMTAAGIDCRVDSLAADLPSEVETVLAWAVREASTNVVRHSGARACAITLETDATLVSLQVDDDGPLADEESGDGSGLDGLTERARRLRGTLQTGARPGGGFRLRLTLPLQATSSGS
jgi:two-component system, NarL family, sensor histidine kinase DesK